MQRKASALCAALLCALAAAPAAADTLEGGPFSVFHHPDDARHAAWALEVLEEALHEYAPRLPPGESPIRVYVCHTVDEFAQFAGRYATTTVSGVARPQDGIIAVKAQRLGLRDPDPRGTLRHELAHVLLARNVNPAAVPAWLNEGIAMSLAKEHRWGSTLRVGWMYLEGRLFRFGDLEAAIVSGGPVLKFGDAYAQSLSMTRFLFDHLGEEGFWDLVYKLNTMRFGDALRATIGLGPVEFTQAWRNDLWKFALVAWIVSGFSVFQVGAILVIAAYVRRRRRNRDVLRNWAEEEAEEDPW